MTLNIMREVNILICIRPQSGIFTFDAGSSFIRLRPVPSVFFELKKEKEKV